MNSEDILEQIPRLRRYARALLGDRYAADDLVQDTLERALSKYHLWRAGSDLRAWLFAIMHNVFVNQVRGRRAEIERTMEELPDIAVRETHSDALEVADVDRALRALPEEQREVLLLVVLEEMSYEEASRALNVPIGTVMSRLSRGRERMRRLIAGARQSVPLQVVK